MLHPTRTRKRIFRGVPDCQSTNGKHSVFRVKGPGRVAAGRGARQSGADADFLGCRRGSGRPERGPRGRRASGPPRVRRAGPASVSAPGLDAGSCRRAARHPGLRSAGAELSAHREAEPGPGEVGQLDQDRHRRRRGRSRARARRREKRMRTLPPRVPAGLQRALPFARGHPSVNVRCRGRERLRRTSDRGARAPA